MLSWVGIAPVGVDDGLDLLTFLDVWEVLEDAHALGLANWVVLSVIRENTGVLVLHFPFEDECSAVLDANSASRV